MNKIKNIITILLLLSLTAITVLLPIIFNTDSSSRLTEESTPYTRKNSEITPKQVAKLYASGKISSSIVLPNTEALYPIQTRANAKSLTDSIFAEDEISKAFVTSLIEGEIIYYYKESRMVILDNIPIALNFITISFRNANQMLEMKFEEKTKTLICIVFSSSGYSNIPTKPLTESLCKYYENELSLSRNEYIVEEERFFVGLCQNYIYKEDILYDEDMIYYYNFDTKTHQ